MIKKNIYANHSLRSNGKSQEKDGVLDAEWNWSGNLRYVDKRYLIIFIS